MTRSFPRPWSTPSPARPVLVGIEPGQSPRVVDEAAILAGALGTGLVCVWVDPAHLVAEREPDGSLVWRARVAGLQEIRSWVLGWGGECEVLEPDELRERIRGELTTALERYR